MEDVKKALPIVGAIDKASKGSAAGEPQDDNITVDELTQDYVCVPFIGIGEQNAVSAEDLRQLFGLSDKRVIRKLIERDRTHGAVILSGDKGYFIPDIYNDDHAINQIARWLAIMNARARTNYASCESARKMLERLRVKELWQEAFNE